MGRALPVATAQQHAPLSPSALASLVVALAAAQLGLLALVDCEASVVGASLFECALLVSRPRVLGPLAASPRWLLWLVVVLGHALCALCALFFCAALAHWLRQTGAPRAAPAAPTPPAARPRAQQLSAMAAEPPVELAPGGWAGAGAPASQPRATPPARAARSPFSASPYGLRGSPAAGGGGADAHAPIVDQRALERFLQSAQPLARRLSAELPLGTPQPRGGSPQLGASGGGAAGGGGGRLGCGASPFFSPTGAASWGSPPPFAGLGGAGQPPVTFALHASPQPFGSPQPPRWSTPPQAQAPPAYAYAAPSQSSQPGHGYGGGHGAAAWRSPEPAGGGAFFSNAPPFGFGAPPWLSPETSSFQKAMYVPASGDRLELAALHAQRAAALLRALAIAPATLDRWRDATRVWVAAVILKPLCALCEANEAAVRQAAARGLVAPPPAPAAPPAFSLGFGGGGGGGLFGGGGLGLGGAAAAAAKPAASAVAGAALSPAQWLAANPTHALAHQRAKLDRFFALPSAALGGAAAADAAAAYAKRRARELARGHCLACYRWDGGGAGWEAAAGLPTDAELLIHLACSFFDCVLPPPPPGSDGRPPRPATATAAAAAPSVGGGLFGGGGGLFGGAAWGAAPAAPPAAPPPAERRNATFWVPANETTAFRAQHFCAAGEPIAEQARSAVVLVQRRAPPGAAAAAAAARLGGACHFDLVEMGAAWPVGAGEHNAFDCLALLALHCEKRSGLLGRARMDAELHTAFRAALMPEPAAALALDDGARFRPLLSVLHPWSAQLEAVSLDAVNAALGEADA